MRIVLKYIGVYILLFTYVIVGKSLYSDKEIFNYKLGKKCLDKAYGAAGVDTNDRKSDLDYSTCNAKNAGQCCCTSNIINLFKDKTKDITENRVNPAVDKLIEALRNQRVSSDIKIEELVHLKYANVIYSFYDKNGTKMKKEKLTMPADDEDGCQDTITFRKLKPTDLEREGVYREGMLKDILALLHAWDKDCKMLEEKNMIKVIK